MTYKIYRDETRPEPRGVQAIVQTSKRVGWATESHGDFYIWKDDEERWQAADINGLVRECRQRGLIKPYIGTRHKVYYPITIKVLGIQITLRKWKKVDEIGFHMWLETQDWVLTGETISNERFQEIFQDALADADFGRKHGFLKGEARP